MSATPLLAIRPTLIPFTEDRYPLIETITGFAHDTLVRINAEEAPGILRKRGNGNGTRYYLHVPTFDRWAERLRSA